MPYATSEVELLSEIPWSFDIEWVGLSGYAHIDHELLARIAFAELRARTGSAPREYDAIEVRIIHRTRGLVATEVFRLVDYHQDGKSVVNQRAQIDLGKAQFISQAGSRGVPMPGAEYAHLADAAAAFVSMFHIDTSTRIHARHRHAEQQTPSAATPALTPRRPPVVKQPTTTDNAPIVIMEDHESAKLPL